MKRITMITEPTILPSVPSADSDMRAANLSNTNVNLCQPKPEKCATQIPITSLPLYIDGSDGSLWKSRECWSLILAEYQSLTSPTSEPLNATSEQPTPLAQTRFVRLSDLLELLTQNNISFK